jgi:hypothetical protein
VITARREHDLTALPLADLAASWRTALTAERKAPGTITAYTTAVARSPAGRARSCFKIFLGVSGKRVPREPLAWCSILASDQNKPCPAGVTMGVRPEHTG